MLEHTFLSQMDKIQRVFAKKLSKETLAEYYKELSWIDEKDFVEICKNIRQSERILPKVVDFIDRIPNKEKYLGQQAKWYMKQIAELRRKAEKEASEWNEQRKEAGLEPVTDKDSYFRFVKSLGGTGIIPKPGLFPGCPF